MSYSVGDHLHPTGAAFATTHWSVVLKAGQSTSPEALRALEILCCSYWYPLYAYVRRQGYNPHDAQDLTQDFFATFLAKDYVSTADRERGRFRWFLLASLKHFLANQRDRACAQKRGGGKTHIPLDELTAENRYRLEPSHDLTADKLYERGWAVLAGLDGRLGKSIDHTNSQLAGHLHNRACGFSFADGHVEMHKWRKSLTAAGESYSRPDKPASTGSSPSR